MKKYLFLCWLLLCLLLRLNVSGQGTHYRFQGPGADNFQAATAVLNNAYYVVGNTGSYGGVNHILLCKFSTTGNLVWSKIIEPATTSSDLVFSATDIQGGYSALLPSDDSGGANPAPVSILPVADQNSDHYLYISGSAYNKATGRQDMLLLKVDNNANLIWARSGFALPNDTLIAQEDGISVESLPDGGAFIVGQAKLMNGTVAVSVARFDQAGNLRWLNRYANALVAAGHYMPRQSCIFREDATSYPTGIAITGAWRANASGGSGQQAFVLRIDHGGNEVWRIACPSGATEQGVPLGDEGADIIPDPNLSGGGISHFVVAGNIGANDMYLFRATAGGAFANGYKVSAPYAGQRLSGISLVGAAPDVAVSGIYDDGGALNLRTYLMKISPSSGGVSWMNAYNQTRPLGAEHIAVNGSGYTLATTQLAATRDAIAIATDGVGAVNPNCPASVYSPVSAAAGSGAMRPREQTPYNQYTALYPGSSEVSEPGDYCFYQAPPPFNCDNCLDSFRYNSCCCKNGMGKIMYNACFRFNMMSCWNKQNWRVTIDFGDGQTTSFAAGDSACHVYAGPGTYTVCYSIEGLFFNGVYWSYCKSKLFCQKITIYPCVSSQVPPCNMMVCKAPPVVTPKKTGIVATTEEPVLFPNPVVGSEPVTLSCGVTAEEQADIVLSDINGRMLWQQHFTLHSGTHRLLLPTGSLSSGIYQVQYRSSSKYKILKLVIH